MSVTLNIDTTDNYNQTKRFNIEGSTYIFGIYWNYRSGVEGAGGWYVDLYTDDEVAIMTGVRLMPNSNVFKYITSFKGIVLCLDTEGTTIVSDSGLTIDNFGLGKRFQLVYASETEVNTLTSST